ncbi:hypothetical protein D3C72_1373850 [compost metagenome]
MQREILRVRRQPQRVDLAQRDVAGHQDRQRADQVVQRHAQEHQYQHEGGDALAGNAQRIARDKDRAGQPQDQRRGKRQAQHPVAVGADFMRARKLGGGLEVALVEALLAPGVQRELIAAIDGTLVARIEAVVGVAHGLHQAAHAQHPALRQQHAAAQHHGAKHEQLPRQPAQVKQPARHQHAVVEHERHAVEGHADRGDVLGQRGIDGRAADRFQALHVGIEHALEHAHAHVEHHAVAQRGQQRLRAEAAAEQHCQQAQQDADAAGAQHLQRRRRGDHAVDLGNQRDAGERAEGARGQCQQ